MRLFYHPRGMRPYIVNWEATAAALIQWLHRDLLRSAGDAETAASSRSCCPTPTCPSNWRTLDLDAAPVPFLAVELARETSTSVLLDADQPRRSLRHHAPRAARGVLLPRRSAERDPPAHPGRFGMSASERPTQFGRIHHPDEAWLARQPAEPIIEPDLPIIDTHHHLWDRRRPPLPAGRVPRRRGDRPQPCRHRVPRMPLDVPRRRAGGDAAGGRDRVRRRHRGDERQRPVRSHAGRRRHRGLRRSHARRPGGAGAGGASPRGRRALPRRAPFGGLGRRARSSATARWPTGRTSAGGPTSARAWPAHPRSGSPSTPGCSTRSSRMWSTWPAPSRHDHHPRPRRRRRWATVPTRASRRKCSRPGRRR